VRFDLFRGQVLGWPDFVQDVRFVESTGAGTCWVLDHYVYPPAPEAQALEAWTTLAGLAAVTERIRLGTAVTDAALRHPAMLAKQVATVDQISGGRVEVAIGAGHFARCSRFCAAWRLTDSCGVSGVSTGSPGVAAVNSQWLGR
jgi:alkanesulfonate monooxygenase SsuD/methylene tetrahydromethanopterin reductase-like flavin-dependent oxidoreductase (luciferase family)